MLMPAPSNLDSLDRALIAQLRTDGRASIAELARVLGVTRATVSKRMDQLEARGVILGYTVQLANDTETDAIRAFCHLSIEGRRMRSAIMALRGMPEVTGLHATNGEWDLIAEVTVTNLADVDRTLSHIREIEGVHRSEISLLLRSVLM